MIKKLSAIILFGLLLLAPVRVFALYMPSSGNDLASMTGINAKGYIVKDAKTGQVLISKNPDLPWTAASLTKLVTALVVLDTKVKLTKTVAITAADQKAGYCGAGGSCIKAKPGVKFTVDGLFHAALIPSANNAANALARSTGLTQEAFVQKMNEKAAKLGAIHSHFNEPTGMDPTNIVTADDYTNIVVAAFSNPYLQKIAGKQSYALRSTNNSKYNQTLKNTDKLLYDSDIQLLGAKTGHLDEALYNFSALLKYRGGQELAVVVLGEEHLYTAFAETKVLADLAEQAKALGLQKTSLLVLGTSTLNSELTVSSIPTNPNN